MVKLMNINKPVRTSTELVRLVKEAIGDLQTGRIMSETMTRITKQHIQQRFPGSSHWNPNKVTPALPRKDEGGVVINIPGAGRAYHDVVIRPLRGRYLTIPIHAAAVGKRVEDFKGLFRPWRRGGGERSRILVQKAMDGQLTALFALATSAFQKRDSTLLPSDKTYTEAVEKAWVQAFVERFEQSVS